MFEEIIGQSLPKKILSNAINENRINHAYIFHGKSGTGRLTLAKKFVQHIICKEKTACGVCSFCKQFLAGTVSDFKIIAPEDGKSGILVDTIRSLADDVYIRPGNFPQKIYIINDADKMNQNAQNAFLKIFEEPPQYAIFILIASEISKLLPTIRSRGVEVRFSDLKSEEIQEVFLKQFNKELPLNIAEISGGSVKTALSIFENTGFSQTREKLLTLFPAFLKSGLEADMLKLYNLISESKENSKLVTDIIYTVLTDILNEGKPDLIKINDYGIKLPQKKINEIFTVLNEFSKRISTNATYNLMVLDLLKRIRKILIR